MKLFSKIKYWIQKDEEQIDEQLLQYILSKYQGITSYYLILRVDRDKVVLYVPVFYCYYGIPAWEIGSVFCEFGLHTTLGYEKITDASIFSCALGMGPLDSVIKIKIESKRDIQLFWEASPYAKSKYNWIKSQSKIFSQKHEEEKMQQKELMNNTTWAMV